ncbi:ATP-binding cassette sub-family G member 4-like [Dermatophagoides pteronyssinus]|uniref:ATP-binding cassette sub-family G member 4-like n=1 Tax=Dermatophagoides pteronyssinus TaxID=6956 RepID=UPI003F6620B2
MNIQQDISQDSLTINSDILNFDDDDNNNNVLNQRFNDEQNSAESHKSQSNLIPNNETDHRNHTPSPSITQHRLNTIMTNNTSPVLKSIKNVNNVNFVQTRITPVDNGKIKMFVNPNSIKIPTIMNGSMNNNQVLPIGNSAKNFNIIWKDIVYSVQQFNRATFKMGTRQILNGLSGQIDSGQVTAIMGPSGAGKSTFLEVLACRKNKGLNGCIKVKNISQIRIAYVPQNNCLMELLTVFETLTFACRLNYSTMPTVNYNRVEKLITEFGLSEIRDTKVARCSGGQQKRISIALELFSKPNLLILDEPTTGLDSASCSLVVKIIRELVKNPKYPMAILATIHQPSWSVFTEFDNVYIINNKGENLYLGSPHRLLPLLEKINLPCHRYNSPPDYIIEIAAGDYGDKPIELIQQEFQGSQINDDELEHLMTIAESKVIRKTPLLKSTLILLGRHSIIFRRNMMIVFYRVIGIILLSIWLSVTFGDTIGKSSGCPLRKLQLYNIPMEKLNSMFEDEVLAILQNNCCLFFGLIVGLISGITTTVLGFPKEMHTLMKEYNNGWYSCISFYMTKTILDIPMQLVIPTIYTIYIYNATGQPSQYFREAYLLLITILVSFVAEGMGAAVSAVFMRDSTTAAFAAGAIPMPMILFGGFLVKYSRMPFYMQWASWLSMMKYAFEAMITAIYGFERCKYNYDEFLATVNVSQIEKPTWAQYLPLMLSTLNPNETFTDMDDDEKAIEKLYTSTFNAIDSSNREFSYDVSVIFGYYDIGGDWVLYRSLIAMIIYLIVVKILTYFVILNKLKRG